jgi:hypothetical protein
MLVCFVAAESMLHILLRQDIHTELLGFVPSKECIPVAAPGEMILPSEEDVTPDTRPYSDFCETEVIGEKQTWNGVLQEFFMEGLKHNLNGAALYYPDWVTRVHVIGLSDDVIQTIMGLSSSVEVVKCHESSPLTKSSAHKMITRFLAYDDPTVYHTIVRDLDGRYSPRELFATNQWISSDLLFHSMRDHPAHSVPVMGGAFGMKRGALSANSSDNTTMTGIVKKANQAQPNGVRGCCAHDQNFLATYIWPLVKHTTIDHDINLQRCKRYGSALCKEWPLGPPDVPNNFFVGAPFKPTESKAVLTSNVTGYACTVQCKPALNAK